MGDSIGYEFLGPHDSHGLIVGSSVNLRRRVEARRAERNAEQARLVDELMAAKEIVEAGIVPSDAEADDFYQAIGSRVDDLDFINLWKIDKELVIQKDKFYTDRYSTDRWFEWLENLTPELRKFVQRDLGIHIAQVWASRAGDVEISNRWPLMPVRDETLVAVEGLED